ncbi:TetR family transcriptional regulator [Nocardia tenerifensis]|uniref:TetR family transcriptional regulator n=1 Tax=Nocardia tenerifensis TaxID=228006 RepID=A0A318KBX2_9NOCA|nr:helix-turn-helix domain-containing protein [Nocardia tenerifensis]PXX71616.1 TetR family transcriptional regulator [Nocardia tenerifensis]
MVDELERTQGILDTAAALLLRSGYDKLTMGEVAERVALHRGLVYLRFKSKDELVEAVVRRELERYSARWRECLLADPQGGSVASVYRAMAGALQQLPLAAAIVARDKEIFGKYLRRPRNVFESLETVGTQPFLDAMQRVGAVRAAVDTRAVAFVLDALTPALRQTFPHAGATPPTPSTEQVIDALAELLELGLTPSSGADLEAGKSVMLDTLAAAQTDFAERTETEGR